MEIDTAAGGSFDQHLVDNRYPGRGLVIGRAEDGAWLQVYWLMGRSDNSRNRRLVVEGASMRTEVVDPAKVVDPSLIIYEAMLELPDVYAVTNGSQTRTIVDSMAAGGTFEDALATREREDDPPNYTPRISGLVDLRGRDHGAEAVIALSILRANDGDAALTDRAYYRPALPPPGYGVGFTTYQCDGRPLPPFRGDPLWFPLRGDPEAVLEAYWKALDEKNRVALAVKRIPPEGGPGEITMRNRFP